jgi:hypothetical protein
MNLLYNGSYYKRFDAIRKLIKGQKVVEFCFGDTIIADFCKKNNISWIGYDINPFFVKNAIDKGFKAHLGDLDKMENFNSADVCIIAGSFYHFQSDPAKILKKMFSCADTIILSEPVINLSDRKGIIGKLAKASAGINGKEYSFRFNETSLLKVLDELSKELNFNYNIVSRISKDLVISINKK